MDLPSEHYARSALRAQRRHGGKDGQWTVTATQIGIGAFIVGVLIAHAFLGLFEEDNILLWAARGGAMFLTPVWLLGRCFFGYEGTGWWVAVIMLFEAAALILGVWLWLTWLVF